MSHSIIHNSEKKDLNHLHIVIIYNAKCAFSPKIKPIGSLISTWGSYFLLSTSQNQIQLIASNIETILYKRREIFGNQMFKSDKLTDKLI